MSPIRAVRLAVSAAVVVVTALAATPADAAGAATKGMPQPGVQRAAAPDAASGLRYYCADAYQYAVATGMSAAMTVHQPYLAPGDGHSLAELAAESRDGKQIVEVGWSVDRRLSGDAAPHLFVFHWVDGRGSCYNGCGFVSTSTSVRAGMRLPASPTALHSFAITYVGGQWRVYYDGTEVGYFPASLWGGRFTSAGLEQWFGEVVSGTPPCSAMGDGRSATSKAAAKITAMSLVGGATTSVRYLQDAPYGTASTGPSAMRYGGSGRC